MEPERNGRERSGKGPAASMSGSKVPFERVSGAGPSDHLDRSGGRGLGRNGLSIPNTKALGVSHREHVANMLNQTGDHPRLLF